MSVTRASGWWRVFVLVTTGIVGGQQHERVLTGVKEFGGARP